MNEMFGLGILLNARDQASASILRVNEALTGLVNTLEESGTVATQEMNTIQSAMNNASTQIMQGLALTSLGGEISNFGQSMLSTLYATGQQVVSTGSQFEQWRMTLKALYNDVDLANQKLQWGMDLAASTPFEVSDVTQALIAFKAMGVEADTMLTSVTGIEQSMLEFIGDLASLRPDVGLQGVMMGVRNLMGGDGGKSLKMRLDLPLEEILGREFGETSEELMQDLADLSSKVANGLMGELEGTWNQMISNLQDQSTRFFLSIADNGAFDSAKGTLKYLSDAIGSIDDERLARIGQNISKAFEMVWKPVDLVAKKLVDLGMALVSLIENNPFIAKLVVGITSLVGVLAIALGSLVAFAGGVLIIKGAIAVVRPLLHSLKLAIGSFGTTLLTVLPKIALVGGAISLLAVAWKNDFGGIRTTLTGFMSNMQSAFKYSSEIASMGVTEMLDALDHLNTNTWYGNLTYKLVKLKVFWTALVDAWNDYTLSDENFQKLNELGLLPLLETILDLKMKAEAFFEGFKQGWRDISDAVKPIIDAIGEAFNDLVTKLFPVNDGIEDLNEATEGLDTTPWFELGKALSYVSGFAIAVFGVFKLIGGIISLISGTVSVISGVVSAIGGFLGAIGGFVTAIFGFFGLAITLPGWVVGLIVVAIGIIIGLIIAFWDEIVAGWEWVKTKFSEGLDIIKTWWKTTTEKVKQDWDALCQLVTDAWSNTVQKVKDFFTQVKDKAVEIGNGIVDAFKGIPDFFSGVFQGIKNVASPVLDWLGDKFRAVSEAISGVTNFFSNIGSKVGDFASNIISGAKGLVGLNTGGYVKTEGVAMLHPNEVVVNDELTQKLRNFLDGDTSNVKSRSVATQSQGSTPVSNDSSITFQQGAIQITMTNGNDADVDKLVKKIAEKLQRERQLRNTLNYRPSLA